MNQRLQSSFTCAVHENQTRIGRRSFMIAAAASIAQPISTMTGEDSSANIVWMAINHPCRVVPGLESQRLPEWLCRAYCQANKHFCLEHHATR
ncbi:hypothetical protein [Variovorax sp. PCZ-1]|uniref:hypothetical protein n=1 Tax=Variovorax sp. PCZ-1 TaxID=2835533 RepID=UPI001BD036DB|nr:hypothetical protein [Variovorax sp. PCZ-1]MBS7809244.1 hypothetical protein [Variovorax sp. PCZ-1]